MKILHIINTLGIGGAQSVLMQLLENWENETDRQMVICLREQGQLSGRIEALGVLVEHIHMQPGKANLKEFVNLVRVIRQFQPDVIQTWLYHADLIGSFAAILAGLSAIAWGVHHTTDDTRSLKPTTALIVSVLSKLSHWIPKRIVCCSDSAFQTHIELGYAKEKMITIWNGVDTARFNPDPSAHDQLAGELKLNRDVKLIGMFARYHLQKDHITLLQAAGVLIQNRPDVHFVLAGEGIDPSNKQLVGWIVETGVQNNMHLLGERSDMPRLMAAMDIITLTSSHGEALPQTLGEAMACGVPCVATNVGDVARLIGDTGVIVEAKSIQSLAKAWADIFELPEEEYSALCRQARERIQKFYSSVGMIDEYKMIYHEVMKQDQVK